LKETGSNIKIGKNISLKRDINLAYKFLCSIPPLSTRISLSIIFPSEAKTICYPSAKRMSQDDTLIDLEFLQKFSDKIRILEHAKNPFW